MERRIINPWQWQDEYGYVQVNEVSGHRRVLFCAGQTSVDANGNPVHAGNIRAQVRQSLDNVEAVLTGAGLTFANVMRLNIYTTDVDAFFEVYDEVAGRLAPAGCQFAGSLLGVARLASPKLMIEFEATAVG